MPIFKPEHLANAQFTLDMIQTVLKYFDVYEVDGVVTVEVTTHGLWLPNPNIPSRQFLGLARSEGSEPTYHDPRWNA